VDRREFLSAVAASLVTAPIAAEAQQAGRVYRLGILRATTPPPLDQGTDPTLMNALRELGYVEALGLTLPPSLLSRADRIIE
jgi:hypothetical protein